MVHYRQRRRRHRLESVLGDRSRCNCSDSNAQRQCSIKRGSSPSRRGRNVYGYASRVPELSIRALAATIELVD